MDKDNVVKYQGVKTLLKMVGIEERCIKCPDVDQCKPYINLRPEVQKEVKKWIEEAKSFYSAAG